MKFYHGTPETIESLDVGVLDFCLTDDMRAASSYGANVHVYEMGDANIIGEGDLREMFEADKFYAGLPMFDILNCSAARASLVAAGFDGAKFADDYEAGEMVTVRIFRAELLTLVEIITCNE